MKKLITVILGLLSLTTFGQSTQSIDLKWKIGEKEKINYSTVMSDIDTSKVEMNFDNLFKSFSDSTDKESLKTKELFKKLNQAMRNIDYVTTLTNKGNGVVEIVMATKPKEKTDTKTTDKKGSQEEEMLKMMQTMNQGVMLRGSVYANGGIHSFWINNNQKNLVSIFFELPTHPVKVGDTWKLNVNLIGNDQNFICDSSYKMNEVTLTDIKNVNGEKIAVIKYDIVEYVKGIFNAPSFVGGGGAQNTMMKFSHQAIAEFSVDKGRWVSYDGIMSINTTGLMTSSNKTKFTLIKE